MQTIQAHVSARILSKAGRLFTNHTSQVLIELLQNARRAGASLVTVTTSPEPTQATTLITFTDNGSGIDDFNKLLHLGASGWDESVERADENIHAPNEFFRLASFDDGLKAWTRLLAEVGAMPGR